MSEETHQENMNVIEFPDEHACYYDEEDEQWFKEKDEQWAKNIPCYKEDAAKVVLNSMDFDFEMQNKDLDDFLKNLATQDSSLQPTKVLAPASEVPTPQRVVPVPTSQRVPAPVVTVTTPLPRWVQVPSPQKVIGSAAPAFEVPTPQRVVPVPTSQRVPAPVVTVTTPLPRWVQVPSPQKVIGSAAPAFEFPTPQRVVPVPTSQRVPAPVVTVTTPLPRWVQVSSPQRLIGSWVPAPQRLLASQVPAKSEEILNNIALLPQNMEYNRIMLSGDSSRSIRRKKYIHWTKEEHMSFLLGLEKYEGGGWKSFSKKFVPSKTPSQIASHAQKYFKRKNAPKKERKRRSIHDTTLEDIDMIVTPCIGQHNWVSLLPNFAMQPHEIQQAQSMQQQFNLHNSFHKMGGYTNFNSDHQQNELHLAVQQFLPDMPHQMGRYGFSRNWPHDINQRN